VCVSLSLLDCVRAPGSGRCAAAVHLSQVLVLSCNWIGARATLHVTETTGRAHGELGSRSIHVQFGDRKRCVGSSSTGITIRCRVVRVAYEEFWKEFS
jgi:hypothetical protein